MHNSPRMTAALALMAGSVATLALAVGSEQATGERQMLLTEDQRRANDTQRKRIVETASLTDGQKHVYSGLRQVGRTHEEALEAAKAIDPELTVADIRGSAARKIAETSPRYKAAEDKRARRAAKRLQIAARGGI